MKERDAKLSRRREGQGSQIELCPGIPDELLHGLPLSYLCDVEGEVTGVS